ILHRVGAAAPGNEIECVVIFVHEVAAAVWKLDEARARGRECSPCKFAGGGGALHKAISQCQGPALQMKRLSSQPDEEAVSQTRLSARVHQQTRLFPSM